jgi:hypothetical protein
MIDRTLLYARRIQTHNCTSTDARYRVTPLFAFIFYFSLGVYLHLWVGTEHEAGICPTKYCSLKRMIFMPCFHLLFANSTEDYNISPTLYISLDFE